MVIGKTLPLPYFAQALFFPARIAGTRFAPREIVAGSKFPAVKIICPLFWAKPLLHTMMINTITPRFF